MSSIDIEIEILLFRAKNIISHIEQLCSDNKKYVLSEACNDNLKLYFSSIEKINELKKMKKCNHDYLVISDHDEIYYQCKLCNNIM